jgi:hypothetical protein
MSGFGSKKRGSLVSIGVGVLSCMEIAERGERGV